jgi:Casein kinase II regulatory subunit
LVQCAGQPVLPVSLKDELGADTVKIYCPKCSQVYHPAPARSRAGTSAGVDGAAFGTTFPHLFLMTFSNLVPDPLPLDSTYVPRVFGFRVHKPARQRFNAPVAAATNTTATSATSPNGNAAAVDSTTSAVASLSQNPNHDASNAALAGALLDAEDGNNAAAAGNDSKIKNEAAPEGVNPSHGATLDVAAASGTVNEPRAAEDEEDDDDALAESDDKITARLGVKRSKRDGPPELGKASSHNGSSTPTFLMEGAAKRRRRTTSLTATNNNA